MNDFTRKQLLFLLFALSDRPNMCSELEILPAIQEKLKKMASLKVNEHLSHHVLDDMWRLADE